MDKLDQNFSNQKKKIKNLIKNGEILNEIIINIIMILIKKEYLLYLKKL
jgi:hypothetical protein